jgi:hypothetical protein
MNMLFTLTEMAESVVAPELRSYGLDASVPEFVKHACHCARTCFNAEGSAKPTWLVYKDNGLVVTGVAMADDGCKDKLAALMRREAAAGAEEQVFITEVYVTIANADDPAMKLRPRDNPGRHEAAVVNYCRRGMKMATMAIIDRPPGCKPRLLEWRSMPGMVGRFCSAYDENAVDGSVVQGRTGAGVR